MQFTTIGVVGTGTIGPGIVQTCVESGYKVIMVDLQENIVNRAFKEVNWQWKKAISKGARTAEEVNTFNTMITTSTNMADVKDCDLVIEAVNEDLEIKKAVFKELGEICRPETILSSNTSALSITDIASECNRPEKVVGTHFFNPVAVMHLVEIVAGEKSSQETINLVSNLARKSGKEPVLVKETPGFIVNRVIIPYINEAALLLQGDVASAKDIDKAIKLGANMPMGPLKLADMIGLDQVMKVSETFHKELDDPKYETPAIIKELVQQGHLGRKTGKGFYEYMWFN